MSKHVAE